MLKPFVILALPRSGTKMFCSAVSSHPDIPTVTHEFRGTEDKFWESPYVLSNFYRDWMHKLPIIHLTRDNYIQGARSILLMGYNFPDGVVDLPTNEVVDMARWREGWDKEHSDLAGLSVSYESLCRDRDVKTLPQDFSKRFCEFVGVPHAPLVTEVSKTSKLKLRNEDAINGLSY